MATRPNDWLDFFLTTNENERRIGIEAGVDKATQTSAGQIVRYGWSCHFTNYWINILPVFSDNHSKKMGSAGFRFIMVMAAIALRLKGEPSV